MTERIELHEIIKLAEIKGVFWQIKTYLELEERLLREYRCKTLHEAIQREGLDRSNPRRLRSTGEPGDFKL
jgi:hypothetical protein